MYLEGDCGIGNENNDKIIKFYYRLSATWLLHVQLWGTTEGKVFLCQTNVVLTFISTRIPVGTS